MKKKEVEDICFILFSLGLLTSYWGFLFKAPASFFIGLALCSIAFYVIMYRR